MVLNIGVFSQFWQKEGWWLLGPTYSMTILSFFLAHECHLRLRIHTSSKEDQTTLIYTYIMLKIEMPFNY